MIRSVLAYPRLLPIVMMLLQGGAAVRFLALRQWGQALYWTASLLITFAVTFMMGIK